MPQPTPKQVRFHYKRLRYRWWLLQKALNDAHNANVIEYEDGKFNEQAPCRTSSELRDRINLTTEKARARAFRDECMDELKDVW
jgi:hypothetical protein